MGDPLAAARHVHQALKPDGTWLVVEPAASDDTAGNMNPVGRVYYGFSTLLCVPKRSVAVRRLRPRSASWRGRDQADRHRRGFTRFRRTAETPFNLVYEFRP
jgi:hypothetical protein